MAYQDSQVNTQGKSGPCPSGSLLRSCLEFLLLQNFCTEFSKSLFLFQASVSTPSDRATFSSVPPGPLGPGQARTPCESQELPVLSLTDAWKDWHLRSPLVILAAASRRPSLGDFGLGLSGVIRGYCLDSSIITTGRQLAQKHVPPRHVIRQMNAVRPGREGGRPKPHAA